MSIEATERYVSSLRVHRPARAMSIATFTGLQNVFHAVVRALNSKTMWDGERTIELLDRLGIPDLETMAKPRVMRWVGNVARMHPGRLP